VESVLLESTVAKGTNVKWHMLINTMRRARWWRQGRFMVTTDTNIPDTTQVFKIDAGHKAVTLKTDPFERALLKFAVINMSTKGMNSSTRCFNLFYWVNSK
jgi:hypothetical protein